MSLKNFHILQEVGVGSFASVFKVRRIQDGKIYAMKKVNLWSQSEKERENSLNQIRILASIKNNHIIGYKQSFYDKETAMLQYILDQLSLITEFADEGDLQMKVKEIKTNNSKFQEEEIWDILTQVSKALKSLHSSKIVHRDLKCANIFLYKNGRVKIGDMNVSKVIKSSMCETQTGTPYYASPQIWKDIPYNTKSDIWSLGCIIYELMMLKPPFIAQNMQELSKKVIRGIYPKIKNVYSKNLRNIVRMMLQVDSSSRPQISTVLHYIEKYNKTESSNRLKTNMEEEDQLGQKQKSLLKKKRKSKNDLLRIKTSKHIPLQKDLQDNQEDQCQISLIQTIKVPQKLNRISQKLPKSAYQSTEIKNSERKSLQNYHLPFLKPKKVSINLLPTIQKPLQRISVLRKQIPKTRSQKNISIKNHLCSEKQAKAKQSQIDSENCHQNNPYLPNSDSQPLQNLH